MDKQKIDKQISEKRKQILSVEELLKNFFIKLQVK